MTQQPSQITIDDIDIVGPQDEILQCEGELQTYDLVTQKGFKTFEDVIEMREKIIQGLQYADNPNVPIGLKLIDEVKKEIEQITQHLEALSEQEYRGNLHTAEQYIMQESFKKQLREKRDFLQSLLDKAEEKK